ncbi:cobalamin biosynthesis protein [Novacetimonas hansenii]|uniref:Cobalamin biosynthesis protein CbiG n=2 Tax=Novacetimonas hansenii TaxID=436 RepID=A0ABQ0SAR9_NOVHA|nr:cobalamin biosynthesis protein [Novacetimonas hansenii]EFG85535.1 cobE protein [Novacetimonas hansenii ATCC 23769]GAN82461.1 cobalamin (vitamin B12) biosynthesis protein CbiG [Novacetimonas hansenii JCM 7643]GEC62296.1 cobalamin biosynthesis protein CbiG [Novacetimonas hansenii]
MSATAPTDTKGGNVNITGLYVAGIGCGSGCDMHDLLALLHDAATRARCRPGLIAIPDFRADCTALHAAAQQAGLPLHVVPYRDLLAAQPRCVTRSARALAACGVASVAEGCAIAMAGDGARLVLPRIAYRRITCAIARTEYT